MSRLSNGHFAKGVSGNPGGRPPVPDDVKAMLKTLVPDAVKALSQAVNGPDERLRVVAAQAILDRVYGKAHQSATIETSEQSSSAMHLHALIQLADDRRQKIATPEGRESDQC